MSVFTILMIVVFVVSTINDVVNKRRKSQTTTGAPPRRTGPSPQGEATTARGGPRPVEAEQSAQVLLPDDLWAILTGERRPPAPLPVPAEEDEGEFEGGDGPAERLEYEARGAETGYRPESREWERGEPEPAAGWGGAGWPEEDVDSFDTSTDPNVPARDREPRSIEDRRPREIVTRPEREIISLEERFQTGTERHAAFHDKIAATEPARVGGGVAVSPATAASTRRRALRRAIILREVLGPPKGLEDRF